MIDKLLNDDTKTDLENYFGAQRFFSSKYGSNAVVLFEVNGSESSVVDKNYTLESFVTDFNGSYSNIRGGTFFEVYEVNNDDEQIGKAKEIAELLNIQLTRKNKSILE